MRAAGHGEVGHHDLAGRRRRAGYPDKGAGHAGRGRGHGVVAGRRAGHADRATHAGEAVLRVQAATDVLEVDHQVLAAATRAGEVDPLDNKGVVSADKAAVREGDRSAARRVGELERGWGAIDDEVGLAIRQPAHRLVVQRADVMPDVKPRRRGGLFQIEDDGRLPDEGHPCARVGVIGVPRRIGWRGGQPDVVRVRIERRRGAARQGAATRDIVDPAVGQIRGGTRHNNRRRTVRGVPDRLADRQAMVRQVDAVVVRVGDRGRVVAGVGRALGVDRHRDVDQGTREQHRIGDAVGHRRGRVGEAVRRQDLVVVCRSVGADQAEPDRQRGRGLADGLQLDGVVVDQKHLVRNA